MFNYDYYSTYIQRFCAIKQKCTVVQRNEVALHRTTPHRIAVYIDWSRATSYQLSTSIGNTFESHLHTSLNQVGTTCSCRLVGRSPYMMSSWYFPSFIRCQHRTCGGGEQSTGLIAVAGERAPVFGTRFIQEIPSMRPRREWWMRSVDSREWSTVSTHVTATQKCTKTLYALIFE